MSLLQLQQEIFSDLYHSKNKTSLDILNLFYKNHGDEIASHFYTKLIAFEASNKFLTTSVVENRLKHSLQGWLLSISDLSINSDFAPYLEKQQLIGTVHARIQVPISLVYYAVDSLKQFTFETLKREGIDQLDEVINLNNRIIDLAVMLFNNFYFDDSIRQKKEEQNLRQHYISHNLAFEFEQSRADLLHWQRELITLLFYPYSKVKNHTIVLLSQSTFGLWVEHRASLLFYNQSEIKKLQKNLYLIDDYAKQVVQLNKAEKRDDLAEKISELDNLVLATDWLLDQVAKDITAQENNKDPLTKMFTRRYLPNIIQHEIHYCLKRGVTLGVIMIDLDHFKNINDQYGHTAGDSVLSKTAALISSSIRAYDYVFRYGGEEFLIIINNTDENGCLSVAEEIRSKIEAHEFKDLPFIKDPITISLGVAIFNKHPDYEQLINQADQALYLAKKNGKNRVELYTDAVVS